MRRFVLSLVALFPAALVPFLGCSKDTRSNKDNIKVNTQQKDTLKPALDLLRQATEVSQFRDAMQAVNEHLASDGDRKLVPHTSEEAAAIRKLCQLDDAEFAEVESAIFRPMDAHFLESCALFRDAERSLLIANLPPLDQCRVCFEWVMRRVQLHEQGDDWLPPAQVLRRGYGGGRDRALVFLELMRQFGIEGCLLARPATSGLPTEPATVLAGVLIDSDKKQTLHLFDPQLGTTVRSSLESKAEPGAGMTAYVVTPLGAMSARMLFLQKLLEFQDRIYLHQDPVALAKALTAATGRDAVVWNAPAASKGPPAPSPVRTLRLFLPADEGGLDRSGRLAKFTQQQIPWQSVVRRLHEIGVLPDLPPQGQERLLQISFGLFKTYYLEPEEMLLRGQTENAKRRIDRISMVLDIEEAARPIEEDREFAQRLREWLKAAREIHVLALNKDPAGERAVQIFWSDDQYLFNVMQPDSEIDLRKFPKKMLSLILFNACKEPLGQQVRYLMASRWHETAAQLQAHQDFLDKDGKDTSVVKGKAQEAWASARGAWSRYLDRYPFHQAALGRRLIEMRLAWIQGQREASVGLWEQLHLDMHAAYEARLRLAEAQTRLGGTQGAATLTAAAAELDKLGEGDLPKELKQCHDSARGNLQLAPRLELLSRDWQEQGNVYWLTTHMRSSLAKGK